jgi:hypothetical protein
MQRLFVDWRKTANGYGTRLSANSFASLLARKEPQGLNVVRL